MHWSSTNIDSELYTYEYFQQEDVCRLCWGKNANTVLFDENNTNSTGTSVLEIIKECLDIDLLHIKPNKICDSCCNELKRCYSYKKFCRETDKKIKSIIENGFNKVQGTVKIEVIDDDSNTLDAFETFEDFEDDNIEFEKSTDNIIIKRKKFRKKDKHERPPYYCHICRLDLKSKEGLSSHNSELHGIENYGTRFRCFGCEKWFKSKKTRLSHEIHFCKGLKDGYKCSLCERFLPKRGMYEYHMRDHRLNNLTELPEYIFKCYKCVKVFKTNRLLKNHMDQDHAREKNFVCDVCGRTFMRQDYLYKHRLIHTGVKRHQCPHCDFKAVQKSSLNVHLRKHTGDRPYSCDMCPQRCVSSSNLRAHRRRHLGDKKYECTICNKKFGYKISLEEHISSTHVRSESHPCEYCGATYTRVRGLRRHLAAKHAKQIKNKLDTNILVDESSNDKIHILKEYELKDNENVLLLKHQDGDVYMV